MSFSFYFRYRWRYYWIFSLSFLFKFAHHPLSRTGWQARLDIFISPVVLWKYYEAYFKVRWNKNGFSWSIGVDKDVENAGYRKICRRFDSNPICNISWRKLCVRCKSDVMGKEIKFKNAFIVGESGNWWKWSYIERDFLYWLAQYYQQTLLSKTWRSGDVPCDPLLLFKLTCEKSESST